MDLVKKKIKKLKETVKKKKNPVAAALVKTKTKIEGTISRHNKRLTEIENKIVAHEEKALAAAKRKNKTIALHALKLKAMFTVQQDELVKQVENLNVQLLNIENSIIALDTATTLTAGAKAMEDGLKTLVPELMDALDNQQKNIAEINEAMAPAFDERDLEEELNLLIGEEEEKQRGYTKKEASGANATKQPFYKASRETYYGLGAKKSTASGAKEPGYKASRLETTPSQS